MTDFGVPSPKKNLVEIPKGKSPRMPGLCKEIAGLMKGFDYSTNKY